MSTEIKEKVYAVISIGSAYITGLLATKHPSSGSISPRAEVRRATRGCIQHGHIHNIIDAASIINEVLEELGRHLPDEVIKQVYVGIDSISMLSRTYKSSLLLPDEGEIIEQEHLQTLRDQAQDANYAGMEVLRIADPRYYLDAKREQNPRGVRCKYIEASYQLITVRHSILANVREVFKQVGIEICGILISPLAEAAVTLTNEEATLGCAYVNIGAGTTSIAIYHGRLLSGLYILPLGGANVTKDLAKELNLMEEDAEELKLRNGSMNRDIDRNKMITAINHVTRSEKSLRQFDVNRIIYSRMMEIVQNVLHIIAEASKGSDVEPSSIVFSGGAVEIDHFLESLREVSSELPIRIGTTRRSIVSESYNAEMIRSYQTALGLASLATENCIEQEVKDIGTLMFESEPNDSANDMKSDLLINEEVRYDFVSESEEDYPEEEETREVSREAKTPGFFSRMGKRIGSLWASINTDESEE